MKKCLGRRFPGLSFFAPLLFGSFHGLFQGGWKLYFKVVFLPIYHPLLAYSKNIIDGPVEHETGCECVDDREKDVGHELHHLHLGIVYGRSGHHAHLDDERNKVDKGQYVELVAHEGNTKWQRENALLHGKVGYPDEFSQPQFRSASQHVEQAEEYRNLNEHWQTACDRIHFVEPIHGHHHLLLFLGAVGELLVDRLHGLLKLAHPLHGAGRNQVDRQKDYFNGQSEKDDGDSVVMGKTVEAIHHGQQEFGDGPEKAELHSLLCIFSHSGDAIEFLGANVVVEFENLRVLGGQGEAIHFKQPGHPELRSGLIGQLGKFDGLGEIADPALAGLQYRYEELVFQRNPIHASILGNVVPGLGGKERYAAAGELALS